MILYKTDTKNKVRYLKITTKKDKLIQESGLLDTDSPVIHEKVCTPKNVGKSNETSGEDQAILEMESKIAEKLDEGYFKTKKEAETEEVILPMLAKNFEDEKHKIDWNNCYVQPKLDGMRALGKDKLISRQGKIIENLEHINTLLTNSNFHFDGECYAHGKNFQENMRLIKKFRKGETESIKYHVYDIVSDKPFSERYSLLKEEIYALGDIAELVPTFKITSETELNLYHQQFLQEGYEGSIIRHGDAGYKVNGRSSNLLKYKDFQDIACKIIDITPAKARPEWGVPKLSYKGKTFEAGTKMSHDARKDLLLNKKDYIGKTAEIRFFEYSEDGIPRFPVCVGIRLDK